ncbi:MAG: BLUF domain-containing protein [Gammaproteobacteria bacterium]
MIPCRLIYRSIASDEILIPEKLSKLANEASIYNRRVGLHGILALSDNKFLQLLEGPSRFVNELFCNIIQDPRHHQIELISFENSVRPEFNDWSMQLLELDKIDASMQSFLRKKYPMKGDQFEFPNESFLMTSFLMDLKYILSD